MLWFKAWRESRARFALSAVLVAGFSVAGVVLRPGGFSFVPFRNPTYSGQIYNLIYSGTAKGMFAILVIFLGQGGLLRERATSTALFTLALPASRARLAVAQIGIGYLELAALALVPALLLPALSPLVHRTYPVAEALHFSVLWFGCGSLLFAAAYFLSTILSGEYTASVACIFALFLQAEIPEWPALQPYRLNILWTMGEFGTMHWDSQHLNLLPGPMPWVRLLTLSVIAWGLLAAAVRVTQRQDF